MKKYPRLKLFTLIAVSEAVIAIIFLSIYVSIQQLNRLSANELQAQVALDLSAELAGGLSAQNLISTKPIDIAVSQDVFIAVYDNDGVQLAASAVLDGKPIQIPQGVVQYTKQKGSDRVTWQPRTGVRMALVTKYYSDKQTGVVVVGKSLAEAEKRVDSIGLIILGAWVMAGGVTLAGMVLIFILPGQEFSNTETVKQPKIKSPVKRS